MQKSLLQLVGRRADRSQALLLRDENGRYFLRAACGSKPIRITTRDAEAIMRQYRYNLIENDDWHTDTEIPELECFIGAVPQQYTDKWQGSAPDQSGQ